MDNKIFKQLLREGIEAHKSGQQKSVQESLGQMKVQSGRGRRPNSVSGDHDDEGDRTIPNFEEYSASGCTQEEWETRSMKGEDPETIKCAERDQDGEEKLIWGLTSTSNSDSLVSLFKKYNILNSGQAKTLIQKIIELSHELRSGISLEEQLDGDRAEKTRVFKAEDMTELLQTIDGFNLKNNVIKKLLRVLDLWGRKNTVRFSQPHEKVQLFHGEESVPDSREAKLAAIDKKRVEKGLDAEEMGAPIGGDGEDDDPEETAPATPAEPEVNAENPELKKKIEDQVDKAVNAGGEDEAIDAGYVFDLITKSDIPEEDQEGWLGYFANKVKYAGGTFIMGLPLDNGWNILKAIKEGNFAAIPGNLFLAVVPLDAYIGRGNKELNKFFNEIKKGEFVQAWAELKKIGGPGGSAVKGTHYIRSMATVAGKQKDKINSLLKAIDLITGILAVGTATAGATVVSGGTASAPTAVAAAATWKATASVILRTYGRPFLEWLVEGFAEYGYSSEDEKEIMNDKSPGKTETALNGKWQAKSMGKEYTGTKTDEEMFNSLYTMSEEGVFKKLQEMKDKAEGKEGSDEANPEDAETEEVPRSTDASDAPDPKNIAAKPTAKSINEQRYKMLLKRFNI